MSQQQWHYMQHGNYTCTYIPPCFMCTYPKEHSSQLVIFLLLWAKRPLENPFIRRKSSFWLMISGALVHGHGAGCLCSSGGGDGTSQQGAAQSNRNSLPLVSGKARRGRTGTPMRNLRIPGLYLLTHSLAL